MNSIPCMTQLLGDKIYIQNPCSGLLSIFGYLIFVVLESCNFDLQYSEGRLKWSLILLKIQLVPPVSKMKQIGRVISQHPTSIVKIKHFDAALLCYPNIVEKGTLRSAFILTKTLEHHHLLASHPNSHHSFIVRRCSENWNHNCGGPFGTGIVVVVVKKRNRTSLLVLVLLEDIFRVCWQLSPSRKIEVRYKKKLLVVGI